MSMQTYDPLHRGAPTGAFNKARSGRTPRRQANHKKANQPWFGPLSTLQQACPECFGIHKWTEPCGVMG